VVSAEADLSFLWDAIGKIRFGTAGYAYLVDEHGNLIAHKDATLVLKRMNLDKLMESRDSCAILPVQIPLPPTKGGD